jgi:hypothetical protein
MVAQQYKLFGNVFTLVHTAGIDHRLILVTASEVIFKNISIFEDI